MLQQFGQLHSQVLPVKDHIMADTFHFITIFSFVSFDSCPICFYPSVSQTHNVFDSQCQAQELTYRRPWRQTFMELWDGTFFSLCLRLNFQSVVCPGRHSEYSSLSDRRVRKSRTQKANGHDADSGAPDNFSWHCPILRNLAALWQACQIVTVDFISSLKPWHVAR